MNYTEEILSDKKIIIVRLSGDYNSDLVYNLAIKYRTMALEMGYCLICDTREGNNKMTLYDGLKALKIYEKKENRKLKKVPSSIIATGSQYIFFKVIEQFLVNAGGDFKVFKETDKAIEWFSSRSKK